MSDPYTPKLNDFNLSEQEKQAVEAALQTANPWDDLDSLPMHKATLVALKDRIREYHMLRHGDTCCYCRTNLHGGGYFMIDREHILPKGKYKNLTYKIENISISCKRCNMQYKKEDDGFVFNKHIAGTADDAGKNYRIIHPNFDVWGQHLQRIGKQVNDKVLVKFRVTGKSEKGNFTYEYFRLRDLEINSLDTAQGIRKRMTVIAELIRSLARKYGQGA